MVVVVVAAAGGATILDVAIIIAKVKIVAAAIMTHVLFLLLRCIILVPSTNTMDKRLTPREDQRTIC